MPLFIPWYIYIPKECFSPLKQSTTAWASLREEDQEQDQQQIKSQVKNLQSKSAMSYINRSDLFQKLFVSKARCPCFIHQNSTGNGAHYTHEHFPPGNVGVCCQSPKIKSGLDSDGGACSPSVHPETPPVASGELIEVVWHGWPASWPSVSNGPTTTAGRR